LEKATLPLQQYLGLRSSLRKERFARASKLSRPLYILCCQLEAYADAFDTSHDTMSVEVVASAPNAASPKKSNNEKDMIVIQPEPLAVVLRLQSPSTMEGLSEKAVAVNKSQSHSGENSLTEIRFQYLSALNIITAEAMGHPNLMINLFPGDDGAATPNLSSFHKGQSQSAVDKTAVAVDLDEKMDDGDDPNIQAGEGDGTSASAKEPPTNSSALASFHGLAKEYPGRPFMWAQWLGGLCFLNDSQQQARLEPSTRAVIHQLHRRVRAQRTLTYLLSCLAAAASSSSSSSSSNKSFQSIPIHEAMSQMFPSNSGSEAASLAGWTEVVQKIDQIKPCFGHKIGNAYGSSSTDSEAAAEQYDGDSSSLACRYFRARLMHRGTSLNTFVEVSPEYPAKAPRWLLQATPLLDYQDESVAEAAASGKVLHYDNNMKDIETAVNAEYHDLILPEQETTLDWILVHQLRKIMTCWAALSDGPEHGSISGVRVRRGRNRRKALAFERYGSGKAC
jgi:hypothetical protein